MYRPAPQKWQLDTRRTGDHLLIRLTGQWCLVCGLPSHDVLTADLADGIRRVEFSTELADWDSGLLTFVADLLRKCEQKGITVNQEGLPRGVRHLLALSSAGAAPPETGEGQGRKNILYQIGFEVRDFWQGLPEMLHFMGETILSLGRFATGRARFRWSDLWWEIEEVGPRALIIVSVISFLVGLILAYLGADQLRMVGAQIFIADLVAIGMVREIGALMTGVIISGRTGAAFAAQLGTMQVNEEIDAFRTMGISPMDFLVLPRMLALMLMVPLLTLYASFVGIAAGMFISKLIFDIGMFEYYTETVRALNLRHFFVGLIKGSVYGALVAFSGCLRGMQCGRNAQAVGEAATSAVVTAILLITISASILTILFYQLGI